MVVVSYSGKEINAKLVYYGAGLSGKTTNLESIYEAVPDTSRGKMVSMKTQSDRTLFFDLLPLDLGEIMGFKTRFLLYTVPGQVFYNATRKLVLKGSDAVVFVADSEIGKMDENRESLGNLRTNLAEYGLRLEEIPWVLQYNKRDLEHRYTVEELNAALNPEGNVPWFEAVANQGKGVFETFRGVSHMLMEKVTKDLRRSPLSSSRRASVAEAPPAPMPVVPESPAPMAGSITSNPSDNEIHVNFGRELDLDPDEAAAPRPVAAQPATPGVTLRRPDAGRPAAPPAPPATPPRPATVGLGPVPAQAMNQPMPQAAAPRATKQASPTALQPEPFLTGARPAPETAARPGLRPNPGQETEQDAASMRDVIETVVPVEVPRGTREIVVRIVIQERD